MIFALLSAHQVSELACNTEISTQDLYDAIVDEVGTGTITKLTFGGTSVLVDDFPAGCKLTYLSWSGRSSLPNLSFATPCSGKLTYLAVYADLQSTDGLDLFNALEDGTFALNQTTPAFVVKVPPSLTDLQLMMNGYGGDTNPVISFDEPSLLTLGYASLKTLRISGNVPFQVACLPANASFLSASAGGLSSLAINFTTCADPAKVPPLTSLILSANSLSSPDFTWDEAFSQLDRLEYLELTSGSGTSISFIPLLHPNTAKNTLSQITFALIASDQVSVDYMACGLWNNAGAATSALSSASFTMGNGPTYDFAFSSCFASTHTKLRTLILQPFTPPDDGGAVFIAHLPSSLNYLSLMFRIPKTLTVPFPYATLVETLPNLQTLSLAYTLRQYVPSPPTEIFTHLSTLSSLRDLDLSSGNLNGTLPSNLRTLIPTVEALRIQSNFLSGTIPGGLWSTLQGLFAYQNAFVAVASDIVAPQLILLTLQANALTSLPPNLLTAFPKLQAINLDSNNLQIELPQALLVESSPLLSFSAVSCQLSGSFPPVLSPALQAVQVSNNNLCGPLPRLPPNSLLSSILANDNLLSGSIHPEYLNRSMVTLDISNNLFTGSLPSVLRRTMPLSYAQPWRLNGNLGLSGPLPTFDLHPSYLNSAIQLEYTGLSWCEKQAAAPVAFPNSQMSVCNFNLTLACDCPELWNATFPNIVTQCQSKATSVIPPTIRESTCPLEAPAPQAVPSGPKPCPGSAPSPQFICINGAWILNGSLAVNTTLTVPPNSIIQITGNLSSNSSIVFNGLGTTITVDGCVFLGKNGSANHVEIELTQEDLDTIRRNGGKLTQTLIASKLGNKCNGSTDLSGIEVTVKKPSGTCRKVKVDKTKSTQSSLVTTFTLDNSHCNVIIIVPSVVGAVIVLTVVAIIVILVVKKMKADKYTTRLGNKN